MYECITRHVFAYQAVGGSNNADIRISASTPRLYLQPILRCGAYDESRVDRVYQRTMMTSYVVDDRYLVRN